MQVLFSLFHTHTHTHTLSLSPLPTRTFGLISGPNPSKLHQPTFLLYPIFPLSLRVKVCVCVSVCVRVACHGVRVNKSVWVGHLWLCVRNAKKNFLLLDDYTKVHCMEILDRLTCFIQIIKSLILSNNNEEPVLVGGYLMVFHANI